ncbi:MAG: hypothetical protein R3B53_00315 [Candidatus Paceibacterota bacterium]
MAMEKFSSSPTPENSDLGPEDIAELEAQAESLGNEAVLLRSDFIHWIDSDLEAGMQLIDVLVRY